MCQALSYDMQIRCKRKYSLQTVGGEEDSTCYNAAFAIQYKISGCVELMLHLAQNILYRQPNKIMAYLIFHK